MSWQSYLSNFIKEKLFFFPAKFIPLAYLMLEIIQYREFLMLNHWYISEAVYMANNHLKVTAS